MQNICVFIWLLKDVEGILSIHAVVSGASTKSEHKLWIKINPRKQEKNKPSEVILWAEASSKTWFLVSGALCLPGVPELKVLSQFYSPCVGRWLLPPLCCSQGVALGLGSSGGAVVGSVGLGVSPAPNLTWQSMQKMNCFCDVFHWVVSDSSQVKGRRCDVKTPGCRHKCCDCRSDAPFQAGSPSWQQFMYIYVLQILVVVIMLSQNC